MRALSELLCAAMEDLKAVDVQCFDVSALTTMTDLMIIASGRSDRQVRAIAERVVERARQEQVRPLGVEGRRQAEWILIDFGDLVVHVMHPDARAYYQLERLWSVGRAVDGDS